MKDVQLIKADIQDLEELRVLGRKCFEESFAAQNSEENMQAYLDSTFSAEKIREELKNKDSEFYLAHNQDVILGYFKINIAGAQTDVHDLESLELERIYVLRQHIGNRIGQLMLDRAVEIASQHNLKYLWLGVWEENKKAIKFYVRNGFIKFGEHEFDLGGDLQTDILMKLDLRE